MQAFAATWGSDARFVLRSPRGVQKVLELVGIAKQPPIAVGEDAPAASHEDSFIF